MKLAFYTKHLVLPLLNKMTQLKKEPRHTWHNQIPSISSTFSKIISVLCMLSCWTPQNRLSIFLMHNKSPFQILHKYLPNFNILKVFGHLCFTSNLQANINKLDSRSRKCFYKGFMTGVKGNTLFDLNSKEFFLSIDVIYFESIFLTSHLHMFHLSINIKLIIHLFQMTCLIQLPCMNLIMISLTHQTQLDLIMISMLRQKQLYLVNPLIFTLLKILIQLPPHHQLTKIQTDQITHMFHLITHTICLTFLHHTTYLILIFNM